MQKCGLQKLQKGIGVLCRVKTWPQLMCCALIEELGVFIYRGERKREMRNQAEGYCSEGSMYVDYKLRNIYKVSSPFILQERGLVWSNNID